MTENPFRVIKNEKKNPFTNVQDLEFKRQRCRMLQQTLNWSN